MVALIVGISLARGPYGAAPSSAPASERDKRSGGDARHAPTAASGSAKASVSSAGSARPAGSSETRTELGLPSMDVRKARADFDAKQRLGDLKGALTALEALCAIDADALGDAELRRSILAMSQTVTLMKGDEPDRLFSLLAQKTGTRGPDLLFELVTTRGSSEASKIAAQLLDQEAVLARGSEAMQIAYKLRKAKGCEAKKALFAAAGEKGDRRTLAEVQLSQCGRRVRDNCCPPKDPELEAALAAFAARGMK